MKNDLTTNIDVIGRKTSLKAELEYNLPCMLRALLELKLTRNGGSGSGLNKADPLRCQPGLFNLWGHRNHLGTPRRRQLCALPETLLSHRSGEVGQICVFKSTPGDPGQVAGGSPAPTLARSPPPEKQHCWTQLRRTRTLTYLSCPPAPPGAPGYFENSAADDCRAVLLSGTRFFDPEGSAGHSTCWCRAGKPAIALSRVSRAPAPRRPRGLARPAARHQIQILAPPPWRGVAARISTPRAGTCQRER
jgi:hypothetical protein